VGVWTGCIWLRIGESCWVRGNEPSGSIKGSESNVMFLEHTVP